MKIVVILLILTLGCAYSEPIRNLNRSKRSFIDSTFINNRLQRIEISPQTVGELIHLINIESGADILTFSDNTIRGNATEITKTVQVVGVECIQNCFKGNNILQLLLIANFQDQVKKNSLVLQNFLDHFKVSLEDIAGLISIYSDHAVYVTHERNLANGKRRDLTEGLKIVIQAILRTALQPYKTTFDTIINTVITVLSFLVAPEELLNGVFGPLFQFINPVIKNFLAIVQNINDTVNNFYNAICGIETTSNGSGVVSRRKRNVEGHRIKKRTIDVVWNIGAFFLGPIFSFFGFFLGPILSIAGGIFHFVGFIIKIVYVIYKVIDVILIIVAFFI